MDYKEDFALLVAEENYDDARILLEKYKIYALEEPFYYANMGWVLNHLERYQEAEIYLRKGIALFPEDAWMVSQLGFCYDRQGDIDTGLSQLLRAIDMGYDDPWLHGEIGWCYKEKNDFKNAIMYFENALLEIPDNVWVLSQAAGAYRDIGNLEVAEEYFLKSYRLDPDVDACFDLANFYQNQKEYDKEIAFLEEISDPEFALWRSFQLGVAYHHKQAYEKALTYLLEAQKLGKDDTNLHSELGDLYLALEQIEKSDEHYEKSLAYYEKALSREEPSMWIYQEMIWIAHKQKQWDKKLAYLKRANRVAKDDPWLMYHFARTYSEVHDYEHAENACLYCLQHEHNDQDMYDLYAWNLSRNHKSSKAIEILEERIKKFGADAWAYGEIGWIYMQYEDYEKALHAYRQAISFDEMNATNYSLAGWCLFQQQHYKEALTYLLKAESKGRKDGWFYILLADTYERLEDYEKAIAYNEFAKEINYEVSMIEKNIERLSSFVTTKNNEEVTHVR